jgi:DNA-binding PadR family transcriptional regulator
MKAIEGEPGVYELIILSILMRRTAHGYLISKIINDIFGPYTKISNGRLYPLLTKLQNEGLIKTVSEEECDSPMVQGERHARSYTVTAEGRKRFHTLMMDTTSNPGDYQRFFLHKSQMLQYILPTERLYLIEHYINYCQAHILHLKAEREDLATLSDDHLDRASRQAVMNSMQHMIDGWQLECSWVRQLHAEVVDTMQSLQAEDTAEKI